MLAFLVFDPLNRLAYSYVDEEVRQRIPGSLDDPQDTIVNHTKDDTFEERIQFFFLPLLMIEQACSVQFDARLITLCCDDSFHMTFDRLGVYLLLAISDVSEADKSGHEMAVLKGVFRTWIEPCIDCLPVVMYSPSSVPSLSVTRRLIEHGLKFTAGSSTGQASFLFSTACPNFSEATEATFATLHSSFFPFDQTPEDVLYRKAESSGWRSAQHGDADFRDDAFLLQVVTAETDDFNSFTILTRGRTESTHPMLFNVAKLVYDRKWFSVLKWPSDYTSIFQEVYAVLVAVRRYRRSLAEFLDAEMESGDSKPTVAKVSKPVKALISAVQSLIDSMICHHVFDGLNLVQRIVYEIDLIGLKRRKAATYLSATDSDDTSTARKLLPLVDSLQNVVRRQLSQILHLATQQCQTGAEAATVNLQRFADKFGSDYLISRFDQMEQDHFKTLHPNSFDLDAEGYAFLLPRHGICLKYGSEAVISEIETGWSLTESRAKVLVLRREASGMFLVSMRLEASDYLGGTDPGGKARRWSGSLFSLLSKIRESRMEEESTVRIVACFISCFHLDHALWQTFELAKSLAQVFKLNR